MPETASPIAHLNELTRGIHTALLTTVRADGTVHSCPMAVRPADADGVLWFLSHNHSEKAEAARQHPQVCLAFIDQAAQRYVSVSGYCELVRDHALAKQLWDPSYQAWLPGGLDDPDLVLMKVSIHQAESWDASKGNMVTVVELPRE